MHSLAHLAASSLALVLASSVGPDAALWPPFEPRVAVERWALRLGDKAFVMRRTTRRFPIMFSREVESLGRAQMATSETVTLAQIETPATASDRRWNAAARARLDARLRDVYAELTEAGAPEPRRQTSVEVAIEPSAVAPGIIAAELRSSIFSNHLMRGWQSNRGLLWSEKEARRLTAEDLFDPGTRWWRAIVPVLLEATYGEPIADAGERYRSIQRSQTPLIGRNGMWLKFDEDEEGAHVLAQPICLPWRALRPFLRKDLPFDPARLEEPPSGPIPCE